jgi:hypothetical protein
MPLGAILRRPIACSLCLVACQAVPRVGHADDAKRACVAAATEGQTLRQQDKLLEARDALRTCAADSCPSVVRSHCATWLSEVTALIPTLIVRVQDDKGADVLDARVSVDGRDWSIGRPEPIDPGEHVVEATPARGERQRTKVLVVDGDKSRVVTIRIAEPIAPARPPARTPTAATTPSDTTTSSGIPWGVWVVGGLGIAALGTSATFTVLAKNQLDMLRGTCSPNCTSAQTQTGRTDALVADVSLGVGSAAVAVAVLWAVLSGSSKAPQPTGFAPWVEIGPMAGGGAVGVRATY